MPANTKHQRESRDGGLKTKHHWYGEMKTICWSWVGAFVGIAIVSILDSYWLEQMDAVFIIGSFGASAVLIYGAIDSPLAQPRNLLGGHVISAVIGVTSYQLFGSIPWFAAAFAVASAISLMHLTKTTHPPGGATALIAVIGSERIHELGYLYAIVPVGIGAVLMLFVAVVVNNVASRKSYPKSWI